MQLRLFYSFALLSVLLLYALFVVGTSVRASGAGMGCPDWPTCFGKWIPPTSISELPADYQTQYAHRGYKNTQFNATKTWTEYGNRLTSALLGACVLAMLFFGVLTHKQIPRAALIGTLGAFIGVAVNAWLGSIVVASNLHPAIITSHLFFSLATLLFLLLTLISIKQESWLLPKHNARKLLFMTFPLMCALVIQIGLGTQMRELLEISALDNSMLMALVDPTISRTAIVHATWGIGLFIFCMALCMALTSKHLFYTNKPRHQILALVAMIAVSVNLVMGITLAIGGYAWLQPLHLFMATVAFGCIASLCIISLLGITNHTMR